MKFKNTPLDKLRNDMTFEVDVLTSYVNRVEKDVREGIESYKNNINVVHEEEHEEGNFYHYEVVEECEGLDSQTFSFESVFEEHFPRLQRSSALITLCSFFEHSLIRLCNDLQKEYSIELTIKDIKGKGIESAKTYLTKVIGVKLDNAKNVYSEIKNIQNIRNQFVHNDGKITGEITTYVNTNKYLSGVGILNIDFGFLHYTLTLYKNFFEIIHSELTTKYKSFVKVNRNSNGEISSGQEDRIQSINKKNTD